MPGPVSEKYTQRGFRIYDEFRDRYNSEVRVQESSLATEACVWIYVTNPELAEPVAHLTRDQAMRLVAALEDWLQDSQGDAHE